LNRAFQLAAPSSYLDDFPVWDPTILPAPGRFQIGGLLGDELVATASLRVVDYLLPNGSRTKFGLIGAVATQPDHAGKGFASEAIDLLLAEGVRREIQSFALWGSESSIYRERDFHFSGEQLRLSLAGLILPKPTAEGFELRNGWDPSIAEFFLKRRSGVFYSESDVLWLSRHRNTEWRTLWLDGKCVAYAAWNRGVDLPDMLHELGAWEDGHAIAMLRMIQVRYPQLEWLVHPTQIARWNIKSVTESSPEFLAQVRGVDPFTQRKLWFSGIDAC
jgi:hypothetical protein